MLSSIINYLVDVVILLMQHRNHPMFSFIDMPEKVVWLLHLSEACFDSGVAAFGFLLYWPSQAEY